MSKIEPETWKQMEKIDRGQRGGGKEIMVERRGRD